MVWHGVSNSYVRFRVWFKLTMLNFNIQERCVLVGTSLYALCSAMYLILTTYNVLHRIRIRSTILLGKAYTYTPGTP